MAFCHRPLEDNEVYSVEPGLYVYGIGARTSAPWFCGRPSAEQAALWTAARDANLAGIEAAVSGQPVSGIDAAAQAVIERAGCRTSGTAPAMPSASSITKYPENMAFCHRPLEDNEVYSVEPGLYVYGIGGFRIDDTVVVGRERTLTATPKTLMPRSFELTGAPALARLPAAQAPAAAGRALRGTWAIACSPCWRWTGRTA